jgi:hypothetical protein
LKSPNDFLRNANANEVNGLEKREQNPRLRPNNGVIRGDSAVDVRKVGKCVGKGVVIQEKTPDTTP